jgi:ribosome-associated protein
LARTIVELVEDKKATNIVLLNLIPEIAANLADCFVICTGTSDRQLKAFVDHLRVELKEKFNLLPLSVQGTGDSGWILVDYSYVIVHLFLEEKRLYYNLEGLWEKEAQVLLSIQ